MRARVKRRQRNRRIVMILLVVGLIVIFAVSAWYLSQPSALDAFDGKPVSSSTMAALVAAAAPPYGAGGSSFSGFIQNASGSLVSHGKPIVLFVGEQGCPYCAEMRWSLVMALLRFGNFTNLSYMTSAYDATDYPTFDFIGSTYTSKYVTLQSYEVYDRGTDTLQTLPANYSSIFNQYSGCPAACGSKGVPFVDFGGHYYAGSALLPTSIPGFSSYIDYLNAQFGTKNWDQVITGINSGDTLGSLIKAGANVFTATICRAITVAGGTPPANVCNQPPINQLGPISEVVAAAVTPPNSLAPMQVPRRSGR